MRAYIAGPLFSDQDRAKLEEVEALLCDLGVSVFLPHKHGGYLGSVTVRYGKTGLRERLFDTDVEEVKQSDLLVALLDGPDIDSGTAVEIGIAYALAIPVIGLKTDFFRRNRTLNNMIWGACQKGKTLTSDLRSLSKEVRSTLNHLKYGRRRKKH
jgi:nucleoside 2-deoxyribosyltransferase